ncbi:MAG: beta-lactamase family protein [Planctomycetes bacterium]|nr:beta-lactamase family protein [Planctomycetota bacterium]
MLLSAALLALFSGSQPRPQISAAEFTKRTAQRIVASGVPGAALAVFRDGKLIHQQASGLADVEQRNPYTTELAFEIGSLSKQFTASALLLLVAEGKLALDAPLGTLLDDLPEAWRAATVEQVMQHVSGIPDYEESAGYDYYNEAHAAADIVRRAAEHKPHFNPGERFEYSNTGYYLLSLIVEKQSGLPFERFLATRVFAPLGMRSSYALERPTGVTVATGYHSRSGARTAQPPIAWSATLGAGGIVSTLADMLLWDEALYTDRLLPSALRAKLWEPARANDGSTIPYGAGWFTDRTRELTHLSHSGQTNGFSCAYLRFPEQQLSVLVHCNTYGGGRVDAIARAAAAHFLPALNYYLLPAPSDDDPDSTAEHLAALRQAVLKEGELELLGTGMRRFASEASFAGEREPLRALVNSSRSFHFLRQRSLGEGADAVEEFLYRQAHASGETFWTMRFAEGVLVSLNWEDE